MSRAEITSRRNPEIARVRTLLRDAGERRRQGVWVLDGIHLAEEALSSGVGLRQALVTPEFREGGPTAPLVLRLEEAGCAVRSVERGVLEWAAGVTTTQEIVLEIDEPRAGIPSGPQLLLGAVDVQDPGNLGTLVRTTEGAGGEGLLLAGVCADPGHPRALRGSAGSLLRLPAVRSTPDVLCSTFRELGVRVAAADGDGDETYTEVDWSGPWAVCVGGEGRGLSRQLLDEADRIVRIPVRGIESLNVGAAAAVLLFEIARQRNEARQ